MKMDLWSASRLVMALVVFPVVAGCASKGTVLGDRLVDGVCRTSASHDTFEELLWGPVRRFPADCDERQCTVFGTNEWVRVDAYPDGTPCRVTRGAVRTDGLPDDITTDSVEYDFSGNVLMRYSLYDLTERQAGVQPDFEKSLYWMDFRRVIRVQSCLALDYSSSMYYYQESASCLKVGVWALDRKKRSMDKLVLNVSLAGGCAVPSAEIDSQLGSLLQFRDISVDEDCNIFLKFQMKANGENVDLDMHISPVIGSKLVH
ncbi:MAG: hypothetical protein IKQ17_09235 [Kiritimatiellae bacterium]|nr:hypothetical protein [Kiritimatiellia bacterium]